MLCRFPSVQLVNTLLFCSCIIMHARRIWHTDRNFHPYRNVTRNIDWHVARISFKMFCSEVTKLTLICLATLARSIFITGQKAIPISFMKGHYTVIRMLFSVLLQILVLWSSICLGERPNNCSNFTSVSAEATELLVTEPHHIWKSGWWFPQHEVTDHMTRRPRVALKKLFPGHWSHYEVTSCGL